MKLVSLLAKTLAPALLLSVFLSGNAQAIGYWGTYSSTMWDTPYQYFTDEDWKIAEDALQNTLNSAKDDEPRAWSNPKSKTSGEYTVLKTVERNGQQCREVKMIAAAKGLRRVSGIAFCPAEGGGWVAIPGHAHKKF
ncbi:MAG: hypothetical protein RLZ25_699 [Pseudomonadota bacterium]|jgi:hypothetical protein